MKLEDILEQLTAWFPPEAHKERKLPGGGKWYFVPHQCVRDRLNEICPGYWSEELKGPFLSGNETVMMCRLTICGVTHEGIADSKTFPELNEEGKEKIIGSPVVNAARHAFRDAAERFGIGAYLDEQKHNRHRFVKYMQTKGDGRAYKAAYDNGWVEGAKPTVPRQPERPSFLLDAMSSEEIKPKKPALYPQHNAIVRKVRTLTGHEAATIVDWCTHRGAETPEQLPPEVLEELLTALALSWAKDRFQTTELALTSYRGKISILTAGGMSLAEAIVSWIESIKAPSGGRA